MKKIISISMLVLLFCIESSCANKTAYQTQTLMQTQGVIWGFDFLSDDIILYTKREGSVWMYQIKANKHILVEGTPKVFAKSQGGMLDVRLGPDKKPTIYLTYSVDAGRAKETRVAKARLVKNQLEDFTVLFTSASGSTKSHHFGSRVVFDRKGHLYFSVGDRGERKFAQDLSKDHGKIYRLHLDGSIPKDNPFVDLKGNSRAIWSYGHRNPQGLYYDSKTQSLWAQEHGPRGGDEINFIKKGRNYGWPVITYGREYHGPKVGKGITHKEGMEQPLYYFVPSIAPSGLSVYDGKEFPALEKAFLSGALAKQHLNILYQEKGIWKEKRWLEELNDRIRNVHVRKGFIFVSTDTGKIIKIKSSN